MSSPEDAHQPGAQAGIEEKLQNRFVEVLASVECAIIGNKGSTGGALGQYEQLLAPKILKKLTDLGLYIPPKEPVYAPTYVITNALLLARLINRKINETPLPPTLFFIHDAASLTLEQMRDHTTNFVDLVVGSYAGYMSTAPKVAELFSYCSTLMPSLIHEPSLANQAGHIGFTAMEYYPFLMDLDNHAETVAHATYDQQLFVDQEVDNFSFLLGIMEDYEILTSFEKKE